MREYCYLQRFTAQWSWAAVSCIRGFHYKERCCIVMLTQSCILQASSFGMRPRPLINGVASCNFYSDSQYVGVGSEVNSCKLFPTRYLVLLLSVVTMCKPEQDIFTMDSYMGSSLLFISDQTRQSSWLGGSELPIGMVDGVCTTLIHTLLEFSEQQQPINTTIEDSNKIKCMGCPGHPAQQLRRS